MSAAPTLQVNARAFALDHSQYGTVNRQHVLGLSNAPCFLMDDGTYRAYFGNNIPTNLVDATTAKDGLGQTHSLPMDVKMVGNEYLSTYNISSNDQDALFVTWRGLPAATQSNYTAEWAALDKSNTATVQTWVMGLVTFLQSFSNL